MGRLSFSSLKKKFKTNPKRRAAVTSVFTVPCIRVPGTLRAHGVAHYLYLKVKLYLCTG